jgi:hypothetical protein
MLIIGGSLATTVVVLIILCYTLRKWYGRLLLGGLFYLWHLAGGLPMFG